MQLTSAALTDRGRVRRRNEDAFIAEEDLGLFAVVDGMGGHVGGEIASRTVADAVLEFIRDSHLNPEGAWPFPVDPALTQSANRLQVAIRIANRKLSELVHEDAVAEGAGATISAALFEGDRLIVSNVGDCRAYLARDKRMSQITQDHSVVAEQVRRGLLSPDEAARHPMRHVITRAVAGRPDVAIDTWEIQVKAGDRVLLCSDGVHGSVHLRELSRIVCHNAADLATLCKRIIDSANSHGGSDNATVVLIAVNSEPSVDVTGSSNARPS